MTEQDYWKLRCTEEIHQMQIYYQDIGYVAIRPSTVYKPRVFIDGNQWCALYGENIQDGVCGFGVSPEKAMDDFDKNWSQQLEVQDADGN